MDNKNTSNKLIPPAVTTNSLLTPVTTAQTLQSTGSATGNPRNKCALKPGHSLMDWVRLGNSGVDLAGTRGRVMPVTREELAKHNTRNDAWMAIRGVVYNVTRYMDFHPGGVEELMRGVGTDATKLFNEVHAWVNYTQLLNKCRIGPLTHPIKVDAVIKESLPPPTNNDINNPFAKPPRPLGDADIVPRLDWIQKRDELTLYFYTKQFCNPGSLIRNRPEEGNHLEIWIFIGNYIHKFSLELQGRIQWPPKLVQTATESGKIEIKLSKHQEHLELWSDLGKYDKKKVLANTTDTLIDYKVTSKTKFNHDSFALLLKNEEIIYNLPVGYHITLEGLVNNLNISKDYTPVPRKYLSTYCENNEDLDALYFLIKQYCHNNSFSQYLCNLEKDVTIKVSLPKANFKLSSLTRHRRFCFLAAGSGLTPFLSLLDHLLNRNTNRIELLKLFYFNKTSKDIWCNEMLTNMTLEDERFEFVNILSQAEESWPGQEGRVNRELLAAVVDKSIENISYIAACGPTNFNSNVEQLLKELKFPNENLFIF